MARRDIKTETGMKSSTHISVVSDDIILQKLEDEFRASRNEQEQFYSLDRPIPKQLRPSLSVPGGGKGSRKEDRALKVRSTTSLDPVVSEVGTKSRPPLQSLDEVVMGTPILGHSSLSDSHANTTVS